MSYTSTDPPSAISLPAQYASTTDSPSTSRSLNTMPSSPPNTSLISSVQIYSTQIPQTWVAPICGAGAGFASGIVTCPLDVIKTKLQAQGGFVARRPGQFANSHPAYKGMMGSARVIVEEEGLRGLYRGLGPMLLGYLPTWAVYLSVYEHTRQFYHELSGEFPNSYCKPRGRAGLTIWVGSWWLARCYSSLTAGACSTILTNPIWVIKTRLMSQSTKIVSTASDGMRAPWHYTSTLDAARKMYHSEGIRAFYSGLSPALLGLTHVAVQFPLYEYFKMRFTGYGIGEHPPEENSSHWLGISAATFLSKICASTATYPHEVIRTRFQTQQMSPSSSDGMPARTRYRGIWRTCKLILREEGWRAFYAGIGTNLVRAVPAAMTTMLTYEWLQKLIRRTQLAGQRQLEERAAYPS